jgi:serine/threonine protein kinase
LKPENVLITKDGHAKIADFGVAHHFQEEDAKEEPSMRKLSRSHSRGQVSRTEGTYYFWAPEMCSPEEGHTVNAYGADVWAVGACAFCMLFGELPFKADDTPSLFEAIKSSPLVIPESIGDHRHTRLSEEGESFLVGMLDKDPEERLSLGDALTHPWIVAAREKASKTRRLPKIMRHLHNPTKGLFQRKSWGGREKSEGRDSTSEARLSGDQKDHHHHQCSVM